MLVILVKEKLSFIIYSKYIFEYINMHSARIGTIIVEGRKNVKNKEKNKK